MSDSAEIRKLQLEVQLLEAKIRYLRERDEINSRYIQQHENSAIESVLSHFGDKSVEKGRM